MNKGIDDGLLYRAYYAWTPFINIVLARILDTSFTIYWSGAIQIELYVLGIGFTARIGRYYRL